MQRFVSELLELGLTQGEAKVYLALVELGTSTVGPITKKANVAYSNVYEILNRLQGKGLVAFILKDKRKRFTAVSPENLQNYLEKKEEEIRQQRNGLARLIPQLKTYSSKPEEEAEIFIGVKGLRAAYTKLFSEGKKSEDEYLCWYIHRKEYAEESDRFYTKSVELFPKRSIRAIVNEKDRVQSVSYPFYPHAKFRFVKFPIPGNVDIFQDKIMIVSWSEKPVAFLIRSREIAESMREYFESVWAVASK